MVVSRFIFLCVWKGLQQDHFIFVCGKITSYQTQIIIQSRVCRGCLSTICECFKFVGVHEKAFIVKVRAVWRPLAAAPGLFFFSSRRQQRLRCASVTGETASILAPTPGGVAAARSGLSSRRTDALLRRDSPCDPPSPPLPLRA